MKRIILKSTLLLTTLLLLCASIMNAQNSLKVADVLAGPGENSKISIELNNTENVVGFQFTLNVPAGLIVSERAVTLSSRKGDHVVYPRRISNTQFMFISYSTSNEFFTGNSGTILEIPIEIPINYATGNTYPLSLAEVILSSAEGVDTGSNHQNGILTVGEAFTPDLEVSGVTITGSEVSPNGTISVSWGIKNIGKAVASGGWTEQISLVSDQTGSRYQLGSVSYIGELATNEAVSRNGNFNIPKIVGMDGSVKVEVNMIPNASIKELESDKANNKALSSNTATLKKLLFLSFNKSQVDENATTPVRATLSRSGDRSALEEFQVTCSMSDQLTFPATATIGINQSSVAFDFFPVDNNVADGNRAVGLIISGTGYPETSQEILIIDDEIGIVTLTPSKTEVTDGESITVTLTTDISRTQDVTFTLTADQKTRWTVPETILLPAGSKSVPFTVEIKALSTPEQTVTGKITAKAEGYKAGLVEVSIVSANIPAFEFTIEPNTISKGDGIYATYAIIKRLDKPQVAASIRLSADIAGTLILPASVSFPAGVTQQKFNIGAVSNDIVDGTKTVAVTASVYLSSCGCTTGAGVGGAELVQTITILDDNGPALKVKANPSTVKAGMTDAAKITISRNTVDVSQAINLRLASDMPSVVTIPPTATIPVGQASVDVNITTIIDPSRKGDQTIRIQAEADNFTSGFGWILVSDQNKPDAAVTNVSVASPLAGGGNAEVKTTIANHGNTTFIKGSKVEYYLSKNKTIQGGVLIATNELDSNIEVGNSLEFTRSIQLPEKAGDYFMIVVLNSNKKIDELSFTNNQGETPVVVTPAYSATVAVDKTLYKSEETVTISGAAKLADNTPAANKEIEITVKNNLGFVRSFTTTTNGSGNYLYNLQSLPGENGHYNAGAGYPGAGDHSQTEFDIAGFEWKNKPNPYLLWEVTEFSAKTGEFVLKNNTSVPLSNVKVILPENIDFTISATPINIPAGGTVTLAYTITPGEPTSGRDYTKIPVKLISDEGALLDFIGWYYCHPQRAKLTPNPVSINTTMTKGATRYYEFSLINGVHEAKDVKIDIPSLDWFSMITPKDIPSVAPYDTVKVILQMRPTDRLQFNVPITGTIGISMSNGNGFTIPIKVEPVSESTGSIQVDVTDDYSYNTTSAPHLAGAKVSVRHSFSGVIIAEGFTGSDGLFSADNIPEGNYTLTISAVKHGGYQKSIVIDPGKVNHFTAFLPLQVISYSWTVVPTEIEDVYQTDIIVEFETNVPRPVIVFEYDKTEIDLEPGESRILNVAVTNKGLIKALDVRIDAPNVEGFTFTPLIDYFPSLNPKSSVTVPLLIHRVAPQGSSGLRNAAGGLAGCVNAFINGQYLLICGPENYEDIATGKIPLRKGASDCSLPLPGTPAGPGTPPPPGKPGGSSTPGGSWCEGDCPNTGTGYESELGCNECTMRLLQALKGCAGMSDPKAAAQCANEVRKAMNCFNGPNPKLPGPTDSYWGSPQASPVGLRATTSDSFNELMITDLFRIEEMLDYTARRGILIYNDANFIYSDIFNTFEKEVKSYISNRQTFTETEIADLIAKLESTSIENSFIQNFCNRWNMSINTWNQGVNNPNSQYPDIIAKDSLNRYDRIIEILNNYVLGRGFNSIEEMYEQNHADMLIWGSENRGGSVCATVTVKFSQTITMTREAFEGTLTLNNGSDAGSITEINLDLIVYNENGEDATHLFQVNKDAFLSGSGSVGNQSTASGTVIFIPTKHAAPTLPLTYGFGGTLSYFDPAVGEKVTHQLYPVALEVNPSPDLVLRYFMQRDILGDDPLTLDVVEPSVPAELALMIINEGYGTAKNVRVESMQPEIIDNQKGLLIDFNIIGSNFNNEPKQLGLLNVNFGNIEPQKSAIGQWWFTSTLMGHFIDYKINVTHLSSFGNKNLSLIKDYELHELIKSVKAYGPGHDDINDFLVNDIPDVYSVPDRIYYSTGGYDEVYPALEASASNVISASSLTATLAVTPYMMGWNYGNINDPGGKNYKLVKVVRNSDSYELPSENFWQTFVTMRHGNDPLYENKLHFIDRMTNGAENYTLYYTPVNTDYPRVVSFENVPSEMATQPVENITVKFNKPIDVNTFTTDNLQLIYQGNYVPVDNILIGKIDDETYSLNLQAVTTASGYYELTVQCTGIKDLAGNEGQAGRNVNWIQVLNELGIISFTTDQVKSQPLNSIEVFFNKTVAPNQFTKEKITLNGNPLGDNISIITDDNLRYTIVGLSAYNNLSGNYELSVNVPAIKSENNIEGIIAQSCKWRVDVVMPAVQYFTPKYQGALNSQNVTDMQITLTKPIVSDFEAGWITLYKGSVNQNAQLRVSKLDSLCYIIGGLGDYTYTEGGYKLSVDQTGFIDDFGNFGTGQVDTMWVVSLVKPAAPTNMRITPDRGISATDNITSGDDLSISLTTNANQQTVALYAVLPQGETLVKEQYVENAGLVNIPITGYSGKVTFKAIVTDEYGNESNPASIDVFIDNQDLSAEIIPVRENETDCPDELSYVSILFTDDILSSQFTKAGLSLNAGGAPLSTDNLVITRISDKAFKVTNFENINNNGDITVGISLDLLSKKTSGLPGKETLSQNIGNVSLYSVQVTGDDNAAINDVTTYIASPGMLDYSWRVTGGTVVASQLNSADVRWNFRGNQTITLSYTTPDNCIKTITMSVQVNSGTPEVVRWQGENNTAWNNYLNWEDRFVPAEIDTVIIPRVAADHYYPVLTNSVTVAEIHFEPGAQLGNQHLLEGNAFVQYDLSERGRWLMLSTPLEQVYAGDFTFGGYPLTWVRTFEMRETPVGEGSITKGVWATVRGSTVPFTLADGFVLWLDEDDTSVEKGLRLLDGIHEVPFFQHQDPDSPDKALYNNVHHNHDFTGGQSTFYNYEWKNNEYVRITSEYYTVPRGSTEAYKLAGSANIPKTLDFGINTQAGAGVFALVGNPYMAVLDYKKLHSDHSGTIKDSYHIWTGLGYTVYHPDGTTGIEVSSEQQEQLIAPLQSFIVEQTGTETSIDLIFKESMTAVNETVVLRSSVHKENKLDIVAGNPKAKVRTFIATREEGQDTFGNMDSRKIINEISDVPEVYTLKSHKNGMVATSANIINNDEILIPIGLATSYTGNITLSFSGMDTYNARLSLIDAETSRSIDLTGLESYNYVVNYTPKKINGETTVCEDRFFIRISKAATGLTETPLEKVNVFESNGLIQVISSASNPIKEVSVYNMQGALLYKEAAVNSISHTINRSWFTGAYIVKVVSEKDIDNVKIVTGYK